MNRHKRFLQKARAKKRAYDLAILYGNELTPKTINSLAQTPKPCSCTMCQNHNDKILIIEKELDKQIEEVKL